MIKEQQSIDTLQNRFAFVVAKISLAIAIIKLDFHLLSICKRITFEKEMENKLKRKNNFLLNWKEYDRSYYFPFDFDFKPNGIPFGSNSKGKLFPRSLHWIWEETETYFCDCVTNESRNLFPPIAGAACKNKRENIFWRTKL